MKKPLKKNKSKKKESFNMDLMQKHIDNHYELIERQKLTFDPKYDLQFVSSKDVNEFKFNDILIIFYLMGIPFILGLFLGLVF